MDGTQGRAHNRQRRTIQVEHVQRTWQRTASRVVQGRLPQRQPEQQQGALLFEHHVGHRKRLGFLVPVVQRPDGHQDHTNHQHHSGRSQLHHVPQRSDSARISQTSRHTQGSLL